MNILMISDVYFPRINGVSTSIQTFRHALAAQGVTSTLIAPDYPGAPPDDAALDIVRVPSRYLPFDPEDRVMRAGAVRALAERLRTCNYDLVHIHTPFVAHYAGRALARELGLPCISTYHTFFEEYLFHYVRFLPRATLRLLARHFTRSQCNDMDAVVVPSSAMERVLAGYGVTRPREILPTGLPAEQFVGGDGIAFRERHGIAPDRQVLLYVGRVAHEKNIGLLIGMVDELRKPHPAVLLLITGEGPAVSALRAEVQRRRLERHVCFLGYLDRGTELHDCYRAADLFVFASRTETQGLVLLEAMALGTPVVAIAAMGTHDILDPQCGARIAPDDAPGFAAVVGDLLNDRAGLDRMGNEARDYARRWRADEMAARLAQVYRQHANAAAQTGYSPAAQLP
ncbi:glycosyltransferase [Aromatoleum toluvorans]|uniref:Glycosyltransferase n=1 Tax=Aromatoleum toluvorans TaxID=92002 RepID=A0ABX1PZK4_9RHOO|nr:glycosyltransferase [Aromatoleum toluvorans]NMG44868.1 glycosyltransferase [Aromatoleum toluvorans]